MSYTDLSQYPDKLPAIDTWCVVFTDDGVPHVAQFRKDMGFSTMKRTKRFTTYSALERVILWEPLNLPFKHKAGK